MFNKGVSMVQAFMELAYVSTHFLAAESSRNCSRNTTGLMAKNELNWIKTEGLLYGFAG